MHCYPVETFLPNHITLLLADFMMHFKVKYPVSGGKSVFSFIRKDEHESGNVLLHWLLYILWQNRNKMSGEWCSNALVMYHLH